MMSTTSKLRVALSLLAVVGATAVAVPALAPADDGCPNDLVPRLARPGDGVCVTKQVAAEIARENGNAANLREPNGGAFGPNTCKPGFVWREAYEGDAVCVVPDRRQETWGENAAAGSGPTGGLPLATQRAPIATLPNPNPNDGPTTGKPTGPLQTPVAPSPQHPSQPPGPAPGATPTNAPPTGKPTTTAPPSAKVTTTTPVPTTAPGPKPACNPKVDVCVN